MAQIKELTRFKVPLGSQEIELQQIDHAEGGMSLLRIRIREGKRFTIFDIDPLTAQQWADAMQDWALSQDEQSQHE
ncbi:MAG: hypothetical protein A2063_04620 [Gallionellales bacterium GWA2_60_142]|jgi:hypothetical protein|nr:MAG: hypothetical protein A2063_04620 [Gallionellales bacterium GWA2_60_142]HCI12842.1 hypothetical protein [Gallionellaceae bacterium]